MIRVTVRDSKTKQPVTEAPPPPPGALTVYAAAQEDKAAGYGRLSTACVQSLGASWSPPERPHDLAVTSPIAKLPCKVRLAMWEPDAIPKQHSGWKSDTNLIVPCRHNYELFLREGFKGSLFVLPLWGECPEAPMPPDDILKFVCVARDNSVRERKRIDMLLDCFKKAFLGVKDVRLTVKQSQWCFRRTPNDERIQCIYEDWDKGRYEKLLQDSHCGVFLSGLEGWNFPCNELMACGRPSIVIPYGGPADFTSWETSYHLDYKMVQAPKDIPYCGVGMGACPFEEDIIETMRRVYNDRAEMKRKGQAGLQKAKLYTKQIFQRQLRVVVKAALASV